MVIVDTETLLPKPKVKAWGFLPYIAGQLWWSPHWKHLWFINVLIFVGENSSSWQKQYLLLALVAHITPGLLSLSPSACLTEAGKRVQLPRNYSCFGQACFAEAFCWCCTRRPEIHWKAIIPKHIRGELKAIATQICHDGLAFKQGTLGPRVIRPLPRQGYTVWAGNFKVFEVGQLLKIGFEDRQ